MAIRWTKSLSVGIEGIDAQHQELFRRARAFVDGLEKRTRQEVGLLLAYLRSYAVIHFGEEEEAMREARFPGYLRHKAQHDRFMHDLLALSKQQEKRGGPGVAPKELARWLEDWLREHVGATDTEMARFFLFRKYVPRLRAP